jgi:predicted lipoprotein with Yx(FWY)xxD motif
MMVRMKNLLGITAVVGLAAGALGLGAPPAKGDQKTVTGWVLDSACAFTKGLKKPISADCAVACAKNGSPLVILQDDGSIYWPIAEAMPAEGQNKRLMPYAGKRITATGKVYARGGSNALVIEKISEAGGQ